MDLTSFLQVAIYVLTVIAAILAYQLGVKNGYKKGYKDGLSAQNTMPQKPEKQPARTLKERLWESNNTLLLSQYNQAEKQFNLGMIDFEVWARIQKRIENDLTVENKI